MIDKPLPVRNRPVREDPLTHRKTIEGRYDMKNIKTLTLILLISLALTPWAFAGNDDQINMAPDGTYVSGQPTMAPDGTYVGGTPKMAPDGTYVGGEDGVNMAPDGSYVGGRPTMAPDGSYVGGRPSMAPDGSYIGDGSEDW